MFSEQLNWRAVDLASGHPFRRGPLFFPDFFMSRARDSVSLGQSVRRSVGPSVGPSGTRIFGGR